MQVYRSMIVQTTYPEWLDEGDTTTETKIQPIISLKLWK